ncbi:MAG: aspartyl protease family protein [Kofleriaceae bacterium]
MATARWAFVVVAVAACSRIPRSTPPPGGASQKLHMATSGHLLVTARIDDRSYPLVLDTGASVTSISTRAARELGIEHTGTMTINDTIVAPTGTVGSFALSGVEHESLPIVIVDMPDALATGAQGILGLDVLAQHDIVVDLAIEEFGVYPAGSLASSPTDDRVTIEYGANGLILLDVTLDDKSPIPAMLDLGATVSVLNRSAGALVGARGGSTHMAARTGDIELAPVRALVRDTGTFTRLGLAYTPAIVLGNDVFENRRLVISYRDRVASVSSEAFDPR